MIVQTNNFPYLVNTFKEHGKLKEVLLEEISNSPYTNVTDEYMDITKSDWEVSQGIVRNYHATLMPYLIPYIQNFYKELRFSNYKIHTVWFQQYYGNSNHGWHIHLDCQWTSVYYLELSKESPRTEFLNPLNSNEVIVADVDEGDLIMFPSFIKHRAPKIKNNIRKTIISWNSDGVLTNKDIESLPA